MNSNPQPDPSNADIVKEACSGLGTDDEQLIKILCCRTKTQLERIDQAYRTKYEKTLWEKVSIRKIFFRAHHNIRPPHFFYRTSGMTSVSPELPPSSTGTNLRAIVFICPV